MQAGRSCLSLRSYTRNLCQAQLCHRHFTTASKTDGFSSNNAERVKVKQASKLEWKADRSIVENWKEAFKKMDAIMDEMDQNRPKKYLPNKFKEMKDFNDTKGKVILTMAINAPVMPSLSVQNINGTYFDLKNLTGGGKVTLLLTCFKNAGFEHTVEWRNVFEASFLQHKMVQVLQLNIVEEWYFKLLSSSIRNGIKSKITTEQYNSTYTHFGRCDNFRTTLDLYNSFVGYAHLIDDQGRLRWTAAGGLTPEEKTLMVELTTKLIRKPRK